MREILFRGRDIAGDWHYGDLEIYSDDVCKIVDHKVFEYGKIVIPETVGQYTGLIDNNTDKIYENDILNCEIVGIQYPAKVVFKNGSFGVKYEHNGIEYFNPFTSFIESAKFEIIGNVTDNPELLKGEISEKEK